MDFIHPRTSHGTCLCVLFCVGGHMDPPKVKFYSYLDLFSQEKWILQEQNLLTSIIPKDGGQHLIKHWYFQLIYTQEEEWKYVVFVFPSKYIITISLQKLVGN